MRRPTVMIVDDDDDSREFLERLLSSWGHEVTTFASGGDAIQSVVRGYSPAIAILDVAMPGVDGLEVLQRLKGVCPKTVALMLSAGSLPDTVAAATRLGATRYLTKPLDIEVLRQALDVAAEAYALAERVESIESAIGVAQEAGEIITRDPVVLRLQEIARRVADTDVPVLITGESGVGKEVLARFMHEQSGRRGKPFIKVNCAALPHDLLESELFGHQRGSFTGAIADRAGKFELADRGTIFLDEIGDMSVALQAKLLHVLQDGEFCRVGGRAMKVDARVVAATNTRLEEAVAKREFRADLYYRLNVVRVTMPPLRERRTDIDLLLQYFLRKYSKQYARPCRALPEELRSAFLQYAWPGNVRELENAVKRYVVLQDVGVSLGEMGQVVPEAEAVPTSEVLGASDMTSLKRISARAAEVAEKRLVLRTLEANAWNRKKAAREMSICYKALLNKLKRWDLVPTRRVTGDD